jgi:hypothetical protein
MGVFEAEVRRHTGDEDILTSRVFGTLGILDKSKFLASILKQCGVELGEEFGFDCLAFSYWEAIGKRTPDVILRDKSILISIESKLGSSVDTWQLVEEYEDGMKLQRNFWLIAVTAHYVEPSQVKEAKSMLREKGYKDPRIKWINWQQIYAILRTNAESGNATEQKLIGDLLSLLKAKGLSVFIGFEKAQLSGVAAVWPKVVNFMEGCSAFFGTLSSRLYEKNITCIEKGYVQEIVQTGWRAMGLQDSAYWLPRGIAMRAWDNEWEEKDASQGLLARFRLSPLELNAGYCLNVSGRNKTLGLWLTEVARRCALAEKLRDLRNCSVSYYNWDYELTDRLAGDGLSEQAFSPEALAKTSFAVIGCVFDEEEMASPKLLDEVEECLVHIRDIINENDLYLNEEAIAKHFASHEAMELVESQPSEQELAEE